MVITRVIDFPTTRVRGCMVLDADGNENIYINARFNDVMQHEAAEHELGHTRVDCNDIQELESLLHKNVKG